MLLRSKPLKARRILLVEDDASIALLLSEILVDMGHQVAAAVATEVDAVVAVARFRPDLMIVDAKLREGDGVSAMEAILQRGWVPHLFISGGYVRPVRRGSIVLSKPFIGAELEHAIARALALDGALPALPGGQ